MKKSYFKKISLLFAFVLGALVFGACNQSRGTITFNNAQLQMSYNQEIDIADLVTLNGCNINDITFVSSNPELVLVTPRQTIVAGSQDGVAILSADGYNGFLEIQVLGSSVSFSAPANVRFDQTTGALVWDSVYAGNVVANNYTVNITKDGTPLQPQVVNATSFEVLGEGEFEVQISANAKSGVQASELSQKYTFTKLASPTNIQYNSTTGILEWQAPEGISCFYVKKDGVLSEKISATSFALNLAEETTYQISVISATDDVEENVFGSASDVLTLTRLAKPDVAVSDGVVTWQDTQVGVTGYNVVISEVNAGVANIISSQTVVYNGSNYTYTLPSLQQGEYIIEVGAVGTQNQDGIYFAGTHYLSSEFAQTDKVEKLSAKQLTFNKQTNTLSVVNFDQAEGLNLQLVAQKQGQDASVIDISAGQITYNFDTAGIYNFYVINASKNSTELSSENGDMVTVVKLDQILGLTQTETDSGEYVLNGLELNNATNFEVKMSYNGGDYQTLALGDNGNCGLTSTIFANSGTYQIAVTAFGTDSTNLYVLNSVTTLQVVRLATNAVVRNGEKVEWQSAFDSTDVAYAYTYSGASNGAGTVQTTSFEFDLLDVGAYDFTVKAIGINKTQTTTLILDAFNFETVSFEIYRQLQATNLAFERSETGYNLIITPVDNATTYTVNLNNKQFEVVTYAGIEDIVIAVESCFASAGIGSNMLNYVFDVYATNSQNNYYEQSETSSLTIKKELAPTTFKLSADEVVSTEKPYSHILDTEILINDEQTNILDVDTQSFNVKIKYIAKIQNYDGIYYIDSDYAEFVLNRLPVQIKIKGLKAYWSAGETSQSYTPYLNFVQGSNSYAFDLTYFPMLDLELFNIESFGFSLHDALNGYVECVFGKISGEIAGSYVNGAFVSGNAGELSTYDIGGRSSATTLQTATSDIDINIVEQDDQITVSWAQNQNATYTLFDGSDEITGLTNSATFASSKLLTAGKYNMSLTEVVDDKTNVYVVYVTRLAGITELNIASSEIVTASLITGASSIEIIKNGESIQNLKNVQEDTVVVSARYIAQDNANPYTFYLNSQSTQYSFARLTALNTTSNLKIYNNIISWSKEGSADVNSYVYNVKFFDENSNEHIVTLDASTTNSIDLSTDEYQAILARLSGIKYISIEKYVGDFVASSTNVNYLTSPYSVDVALKIIDAPTNVKIELTDDETGDNAIYQNSLTISWSVNASGVEISGYTVEITYNGQKAEYESGAVFTVGAESDLFKAEGEWSVRVRALGANDSILSEYSQSVSVTRLAQTESLTLTKAGVIAWSKVTNAGQYIVAYTCEAGSDSWFVPNTALSSDNFASVLEQEFAGLISVTLYALGDGETTLTSAKTANFTRLEQPLITYQNDRLVLDNYSNYPQNTKLFVKATINSNIVINKEISLQLDENNKYAWYYPTEFSYVDDSGNTVVVDPLTQQQISFEIYACNSSAEYLNSNKVSQDLTILGAMTDLKVVRNSDGVLHILATNNNSDVVVSKVTLNSRVWSFDGDVDLALSDSILEEIPVSWSFGVQAIGASDGSTIYINSKIVYLTGTRLGVVSGLTTSNGAITWNAVTGASDYRLTVDNKTNLTGYGVNRTETLLGDSFASGDHVICVRALGNVGSEAISSNIILDGDRSADYTVTKLEALSDFTVENGLFTFTPVQMASEYIIQAYADLSAQPIAEYSLLSYTAFPDKTNANGYYYSSALLNKLDEVATLYIKIYNKTTQENYVYSDYAKMAYGSGTYDYVTIAKLKNVNDSVELYHQTKPDGVLLDYTKTYATWAQNTATANKYILNIDGTLSLTESNSYILDETGDWSVGTHTISYAQVGSQGFDANGLAYLTADFSQSTKLTKLRNVTPYLARLNGVVSELCISYSTVSGADKYYSYLEGEYFGEYSNAGIAIMLDGISEGYVYSNFAMRAVNTTDITYLASNVSYLTVFDDEVQEEKTVGIAKVKSPQLPTFNDGAFYWEFTDAEWLKMLANQDTIYSTNKLSLSFGQLLTSKFIIKFTSTTAPITSYTYVDYVRNYIYVSDTQFNTLFGYIDTLASTLELSDEQVYLLKQNVIKNFGGGFASANYNFSKFATSLPSGAYTIEIKTVGSGLVVYEENRNYEAWFSSNFINIGTKYVASAPNITAVASAGKYSLKFTNINVDTSYFDGSISYSLFGTYYDEEYDVNRTELVTTLTYASLNNSADVIFDLTALIESEVLTSKYISLFVTVSGNDSNILNGKTSNTINIQILNAITAKVERGIIYWSAQEFASKYQAVYLKSGESEASILDFAVVEETEWYYWLASELIEGASYAVSLQACGLVDATINNAETFIMSGKVTPIGTVNKLDGISKQDNGVDIQNGLFVWGEIANATAYDVYRVLASGGSVYAETAGLNNYYETTVTNLEKYYYCFMAVGTELEDLTEQSNIYVNSDLSGKNQGRRVADIKAVNYNNAIISFTPTDKTGYYKLTFYKLTSSGERSEAIVVYTTETNFDTNTHESLLASGRYDVEIQALYKDKTLVTTTTDCYYLISAKHTTTFIKFDKVYNIKVGEYDIPSDSSTIHYDGGVISWAHDNTVSGLSDSMYEYKLVFKAYNEAGSYVGEEIKTVPSSQKYFEGVVFEDLDATDKISLEIYVYPTSTAINSGNYVHSLGVTYGTYTDGVLTETTYLHQYMQIDETKLSIGITEASQLMLDWTDGISGTNTGDFMYEISFSIGGEEQTPMTTNNTYLIIGEQDEGLFADDSATTVVLKIRVIPTSENYISSAWTNSKEVARPQSVSNLVYDATTCTITWDAYSATSNWDSYKYKVRDEVTYVDINGDKYVEVYVITASVGDEVYTPFVIGTHKISVAVMVSNSNQENSDFISAYKTVENVEFNMFAIGSGTEDKPYVVLNAEQFANMQYRMAKDSKLNEYYLTQEINEEITINNQKVTDALSTYYFKQEGHITLVKNQDVDQTLYNNENAFSNIYDGDYYSLTLAYTHIDDTADYEHISIFRLLGESAVIKNVKLLFEFNATNNILKGSGDFADISVLCEQNNGTIENVVIGNANQTITLKTLNLIMSLSLLVGSNYGTITNIQNNYNVVIEDTNVNVQQQINYAPMAINNYGTITYAKNTGDISVNASNLFVGGLVVNNSGTNAKITGGANTGAFDIYYKDGASSNVGGLVAKNSGSASLAYCYNIGAMQVGAGSGILPSTAYVGGLIGYSSTDAITYSYVNSNIQTTISNFNVYQIIGYLQSSQSLASNVFYNANISAAAVRGTTSSGVVGYTTSPLDCNLYGTGTLFNKADVVENNPRLDWEAKFENIVWQEEIEA